MSIERGGSAVSPPRTRVTRSPARRAVVVEAAGSPGAMGVEMAGTPAAVGVAVAWALGAAPLLLVGMCSSSCWARLTPLSGILVSASLNPHLCSQVSRSGRYLFVWGGRA